MKEPEVTVEAALRRAFWTVKLPSMVCLLGPMFAFVVTAKLKYIPSIGYPGMKWFIPTFLVAFLGGWLVWSIQIPRWRLWAYRRVNDIKLLKEMAVEKQIIWPEGSSFEKTEFMSREVREELKRLETSEHGA